MLTEERKKWLQEVSYGYGLDGGGYEFEYPDPRQFPVLLKAVPAALLWDDPDPDYVPWIYDASGSQFDHYGLTCPIYVFDPHVGFGGSEPEWPKRICCLDDPETDHYRLVGTGRLAESERDCDCHGHWCVNEDDLWKAQWAMGERDSEGNMHAHPKCPRCEGDAYVTSHGGYWALYSMEVEDDG